MTLPANSVFLPVLDDLLSPDLRPVLQTPTADLCPPIPLSSTGGKNHSIQRSGFANVTSTADGPGYNAPALLAKKLDPGNETTTINTTRTPEEESASRKIQRWWKSNLRRRHPSLEDQLVVERAKHSIRHARTEEHIQFLETEVSRLKSAWLSERKMRCLQQDAIRSLFNQLMKMSSADTSSVMTQSMPNGLTCSPRKKQQLGQSDSVGMSMSCTAAAFHSEPPIQESCSFDCSKKIQLLSEKMSTEIEQLKEMILSLKQGSVKENSDVEMESGDFGTGASGDSSQPLRPFSLNIVGMTSSMSQVEAETPEITEFAKDMAKKLVEKAVESEVNEDSITPKSNIIKERRKYFSSS